MIESVAVWGIASFIFVKFCGYPPEGCMSAFFIIAGFGLLIEHKRRTLKSLMKAINEAGKVLQESSKKSPLSGFTNFADLAKEKEE